MTEDKTEKKSFDSQSVAGKYLTFALGKEDFGIEILKVREIIGLVDITIVPKVPKHMKGIINLRGIVIPVIDLRLKFSMEAIESTDETCIIVVTIDEVLMGILIDKVNEVLDITQENIEPSPRFGANVDTGFILGIGKVGNEMKMLLDIHQILNSDIIIMDRLKKEV